MSENPYAAQMTGTSDFGSEMPVGPSKTSTLAIVAFVVALISIVGCCVPGLPAIGALLGVFAIIKIGKSNGRLTGNGFAIAALVIGLLMSVIQTVAWVAMNGAAAQSSQLNAPVDAIEADDFATARAQFRTIPAEARTDQVMIDFKAAYTADVGSFQSSPDSLFALMGAYAGNGQVLQQMQQPSWPYPNQTIPWPATFANGEGFVLYIPDEGAAGTSGVTMPLSNLGVAAPSGNIYWRLPPGGALPGTTTTPDAPSEPDAADAPATDEQPVDEPAEAPAGDGG